MKKIANHKLIVFLALSISLTGCYSSRTFQYKFTDSNRGIIRYVLSNGKVACENCYFNGACVQIVDSLVSNDKYELNGKCALYSYNVVAESLKNGSEIKVKVKCALLIGRSKISENYFLDEVAAALFNANQDYIRTQQKILNDQQEKKE